MTQYTYVADGFTAHGCETVADEIASFDEAKAVAEAEVNRFGRVEVWCKETDQLVLEVVNLEW